MALRPFSSSDDPLEVLMDRPEGPYYPGDLVRVTVLFQPKKDVSVRQIRATLAAWETYVSEDSDGDRTTRTVTDQSVSEQVWPVGRNGAGGSGLSREVEWQFPRDAMPPYAGRSLRCGWSIRVSVDIERKKDVSQYMVVPLVVPPPEERAGAGAYGEASHPDKASMHLWLPSLAWVEGETIIGKLSVVPHQAFDAREVQINLNRREQVHAPRLKTSATDRIARQKVAGKTKFAPQQALEFPFSLDVPELGCPSRQTEHTTVTHTLEAVLSRRLRTSYKVSMNIEIYGGH